MNQKIYSVIRGSGIHLPQNIIDNSHFLHSEFFESNGTRMDKTNSEIVEKFKQITTIEQRRYVDQNQVTSDIAFLAAKDTLSRSDIDPESLDYIIVAHNFGDVPFYNKHSDMVPALASRVKQKLGIVNPYTIAYDLPFGCPGWIQAVIQADYYIKSGDATRIMVIGAEVLSRVCDPHDRDSMIYADGAAAIILEGKYSDKATGIVGHITRSDTLKHAQLLHMAGSYHKEIDNENDIFLKMDGRKLYQYALENVPHTIQLCLNKCKISLSEISKILIHQANGKMDEAILKRTFELYGIQEIPDINIMPMTISWLGNSSVATIPSLVHLYFNGFFNEETPSSEDYILLASVGAGMNINALVYKME